MLLCLLPNRHIHERITVINVRVTFWVTIFTQKDYRDWGSMRKFLGRTDLLYLYFPITSLYPKYYLL